MNILTYEFMIRAMIAAAATGLAAPAVGTYLVQRRMALLGDGIGHVAVTGVAIGLATQTAPTWTAIVVAIMGAVLIEVIREREYAGGDVALALLFYGGISGGILITGIAGQTTARLQEFLFGSITTLTGEDVVITLALAAVVIAVGVGLSPQLFAVAQDSEFASVSGMRVRAYNLTIAVMAAVTVTVAMRTVGLLLVSAIMVVPVATAQQLTRSFRTTLLSAMALGVVASLGGLLISTFASEYASVQPGPTIVMLALACFVLTWPVGLFVRHRERLRRPFGESPALAHETVGEHPHQHGEDCGHPAVEHGDHVDYIHHGHRHAAHGGHYDEH